MNLGVSLEMALAKRQMQKKDFAASMGTTSQQVSNWIKTGAIKQSSIVDMCVILEMKASEFVALGE